MKRLLIMAMVSTVFSNLVGWWFDGTRMEVFVLGFIMMVWMDLSEKTA